MNTHLAFPYRFDDRGRTASPDDPAHLRDLIEQVLFTAPGERVNRPTFGSGLLQLVFQPNGAELAAALQSSVHGALQQWLGELILVQEVRVEAAGNVLDVTLRYVVRRTQQPVTETFSRAS